MHLPKQPRVPAIDELRCLPTPSRYVPVAGSVCQDENEYTLVFGQSHTSQKTHESIVDSFIKPLVERKWRPDT